jgi:hypothetical protein
MWELPGSSRKEVLKSVRLWIYSMKIGVANYTRVVGDWNGDGKTETGVTNSVDWYLDYNGNGLSTDRTTICVTGLIFPVA